MARDFIKVDTSVTTATEARELLEFVDTLRRTYELGTRIRAKMRHNFDDQVSPIVWNDLETLWGLSAGNGVKIFTFVDGSVGVMEGAFQNSNAKDMTETVGEGKNS